MSEETDTNTDLVLRFRPEDMMWNCYVHSKLANGPPIPIGSISFSAVRTSPELREAFMSLMRMTFAHMLRESVGSEVVAWDDPIPTNRQ